MISEEKRLQIAELYRDGDLSVGSIAEKLGVSLRTVHNYKNYRETINRGTIQTEKNDESLTDSEMAREVGISEDVQEEPKGIKFIGGKKKHQESKPVEEEPEKPEIDWKAINEKKKRDDDIATVALVGGGLAAIGILGYLAHRSQNNNQNSLQSSWNDQGTSWS